MAKTPHGEALGAFINKITARDKQGVDDKNPEKDLPCEIIGFPDKSDNGDYNPSIVKVKFRTAAPLPDVIMAVDGARNGLYVPLQIGDMGLARHATGNTYTGEITGLGGKQGDVVVGNLFNMTFVPTGKVGNAKIKPSAAAHVTMTMPLSDLTDYTSVAIEKEYYVDVNTQVNAAINFINSAHSGSLQLVTKTLTKPVE